MKQGVLTLGRVHLLLHRGTLCFCGYGRRNGEHKRKSIHGCIVSRDLSVLNLFIVKTVKMIFLDSLTLEAKNEMTYEGVKDPQAVQPFQGGWCLSICQHIAEPLQPNLLRRLAKASKIQRLVTPLTLQRRQGRILEQKKKRIAKAKAEAAEYQKLLATRLKEQRERRS